MFRCFLGLLLARGLVSILLLLMDGIVNAREAMGVKANTTGRFHTQVKAQILNPN